MSLIFTKGYLSGQEVGAETVSIPENTFKIILMSNGENPTYIRIYENTPYETAHSFYLHKEPIILNIDKKNKYQIDATNKNLEQKVQIFCFSEKI